MFPNIPSKIPSIIKYLPTKIMMFSNKIFVGKYIPTFYKLGVVEAQTNVQT